MEYSIYDIAIDKHLQKRIKLVHLKGFKCSVRGNTIACDDGEKIRIVADTAENLDCLQLSFQLSYRYLDKWQHYFRLVNKNSSERRTQQPFNLIDINRLVAWSKKFSELHKNVRLFLHRASDFIYLYSETAIINALFALELQVNLTYDSKLNLPKRDKLHQKICNLRRYSILSNDDQLWQLLALKELRNKLAHGKWELLQNEPIVLCKGIRAQPKDMRIFKILHISQKHFTENRLDHEAAKLVLGKAIKHIMLLRKLS